MNRKKFKKGDIVVCIDNDHGNTLFPFTFEKRYEVVIIDNYNTLGLINDRSKWYAPNWNRFALNKEHRKLKLQEIKRKLNEQ